MLRFASGQRNFLAAVVVFCLVAVINWGKYLLPHSPRPDLVPTDSLIHRDNHCDPLSVPLETVVIIKTGASEIYDKLPTQLLTGLRCYDDILFFSDLEQNLGPYAIHDALSNVTESVQRNNPQFDYYRMLHEYNRNGQDIGALREETGKAAWSFLHMLEKTWKLRPNRKWYIYIEADTYLVQSNLHLWLERLDSSKPLYFGSPTYVNGEAFSHGGSGFILSGVALSRFANGDEGVAARYDEEMLHQQFGDYVLMKALGDKGIKFSAVWPMLQAEKPSTIPFGPGPDNGVRHWCQPIVTMHHIPPNVASRIWAFEQHRHDTQTPLLFKDLYEGMIAPEMRAERDDWYNLSDDLMYRAPGVHGDRQKAEQDMTPVEREAHLSFLHCSRACEEQNRCLQFVYFGQTCGFSYSYRLGEKRAPEDGKSYKSGWVLHKIARDQNANPCNSPIWLV